MVIRLKDTPHHFMVLHQKATAASEISTTGVFYFGLWGSRMYWPHGPKLLCNVHCLAFNILLVYILLVLSSL